MPDDWWDESPIIQHERAASEARGLQNGVLDVVVARFPHLADLARQKVNQIDDPHKLLNLLTQLFTVSDEASIRQLLDPTTS